MPKILCVWASKSHHVSMTFPEHDSVLQPPYPIFALTGGGTILEATLLICIVHLPWSHSGVKEVSFQRLIVQTRSTTRAVKKTNLQWDWLLYRGFICVQQEKKSVSDKSSDETKWEGVFFMGISKRETWKIQKVKWGEEAWMTNSGHKRLRFGLIRYCCVPMESFEEPIKWRKRLNGWKNGEGTGGHASSQELCLVCLVS